MRTILRSLCLQKHKPPYAKKNSEKPEFGENMLQHIAISNKWIANRDNAHSPTGYLGPQVSSYYTGLYGHTYYTAHLYGESKHH